MGTNMTPKCTPSVPKVGHKGTHVLIPEGAENMWYWGRTGSGTDPWYGTLNLPRQSEPGDWAAPLAAIRLQPLKHEPASSCQPPGFGRFSDHS